jgi:hypothetical protein
MLQDFRLCEKKKMQKKMLLKTVKKLMNFLKAFASFKNGI